MSALHIPKLRAVDIRCEGDRVLVLENGRLLLDLPWRAADDLARALTAKARQAEEIEHADAIAHDSAILLRAGANFGLSRHPKIIEEAKKEAVHNRDLRRFMPGGVKSKEAFGTPTVAHSKPKRTP